MHTDSPPISISEAKDLHGKRVIVRASLNVPIRKNRVANYFRIMRAMPTLLQLKEAGARIIIISHLGRDPKETLRPVADALGEHIPLTFVPSVLGSDVEHAIASLKNGEALLLENLRSIEGEVTNDPSFAKALAEYGDVYVNDAFPASHREHASIVGIPKYIPGYAGATFLEEYKELEKAMDPKTPNIFILGGAKFETKEPLVKKYIDTYDHVFVGGALANDFFKAAGKEVGMSTVSKENVVDEALLTHEKILLPVDVTAVKNGAARVVSPEAVVADEAIFDAGPKTIEMLNMHIQEAAMILWNGPLGNYEEGFDTFTHECAKRIAESDAYTIVGGGDTVAAIESLCLNDRFSFISTAGGAMLVFLENGTLPGIQALQSSHKRN